MSKYGNRKVTLDGYTFDSKAEARRYNELKVLEQAGIIRDLQVHPVFVLQEGFKDRHGKRQRAITYEGDFQYIEVSTDVTVVEDVKGVKTDVFQIKSKLFMRRYPELDLRLVMGGR